MATAQAKLISVEAVERVLDYLVMERQRLRSHDASAAELEANRLAIAAMQEHLGRTALRRYQASSSSRQG
jgi:coenzyme F420-reducing hydrogenase delta subunit